LGWRLWVLGYRVCSDAIAHRHHELKYLSNYQQVLAAIALYSVIKNYSDENLGCVACRLLATVEWCN